MCDRFLWTHVDQVGERPGVRSSWGLWQRVGWWRRTEHEGAGNITSRCHRVEEGVAKRPLGSWELQGPSEECVEGTATTPRGSQPDPSGILVKQEPLLPHSQPPLHRRRDVRL